MKVVLTGGGSGGHFYPLIAVVEGIEEISAEKKLIEPRFFYIGPTPFDPAVLLEHDIDQRYASAGKMRRGENSFNIFSYVLTFGGIISSIAHLFSIYPDVVFSTGGYAAFPTLVAARILRIPVVIYDADAKPGRVSLWSSKFARWIAVAHPDAAKAFPEALHPKIARTGHPIRTEIESAAREGGHEFLKLDPTVPTIFVMGGSQGAQTLNNVVLDALPSLLERYNVVHQTGKDNFKDVTNISSVALRNSRYAERYRPYGLLNALALKMAAGITSLVVARAGSGTIFEVASWGIPSILVPIPEDVSRDQTENAFSYMRAGAAIVIEQRNLAHHVLLAEIDRLMNNPEIRARMSEAGKVYSRPQAGRKIGQIILETALEHEPS